MTDEKVRKIFESLADEGLPILCLDFFKHLVVYESGYAS
jgi:hypothetical protein